MMSSILKTIPGRGLFGSSKEFKANLGYRILMVFGGGLGRIGREREKERSETKMLMWQLVAVVRIIEFCT